MRTRGCGCPSLLCHLLYPIAHLTKSTGRVKSGTGAGPISPSIALSTWRTSRSNAHIGRHPAPICAGVPDPRRDCWSPLPASLFAVVASVPARNQRPFGYFGQARSAHSNCVVCYAGSITLSDSRSRCCSLTPYADHMEGDGHRRDQRGNLARA